PAALDDDRVRRALALLVPVPLRRPVRAATRRGRVARRDEFHRVRAGWQAAGPCVVAAPSVGREAEIAAGGMDLRADAAQRMPGGVGDPPGDAALAGHRPAVVSTEDCLAM